MNQERRKPGGVSRVLLRVYIDRYHMEDGNIKYEIEHQKGLSLLCHGLKETYNFAIDINELLKMIDHGEHGKPCLIGFDDIYFNISHCDALVACVISDRPVGIDLERIVDFKDSLAKKVLTEEELQLLMQFKHDNSMYKEMFFRFWTLKESYIKWDGSGFFKEPKEVSFGLNLSGKSIEVSCSDDRVSLCQEKIEEDCILSVCSECGFGEEMDIRWIVKK